MEYRVLKAITGRKALETLKAYKESIDLVLLDARLPDLEAHVVYREMQKLQPEIKVVACSGFDKSGPVKQLLDAGICGFLQKPFSAARLSETIQSVLGQRDDSEPAKTKKKRNTKHLRVV